MAKETHTLRPQKEYADEIDKFLEKEKKRRKSASLSNTIQAIILDFKNGVTIYEPKRTKK